MVTGRNLLHDMAPEHCAEARPELGFSTLLGWAFGPRNFMKKVGQALSRVPQRG
jgi:hypothetical protein